MIQKENELINILKHEVSGSEILYLSIKSFLDMLSFIYSEDIVSLSKKKNELQYEIDIISGDLKKKGIIKR